ncbi:trypsin-3 [Salmo trutta]|uniref:Trypsin-3-like n=1 Tax=Salmo trutta TaxID=8032 RepID=A0A674BHK0_SALTR|nr:trypsin-3-like [Salmo trutta]
MKTMKTMMILSGVLLLSLMLAEATLGNIQKRIIGGHDCGATERLYHAVIEYHKDIVVGKNRPAPAFTCGGSLISKQWVLTVAHCAPDADDIKDGWKLYVRLGAHPSGLNDVTLVEENNIHIFKDKGNIEHDIMLLHLTVERTAKDTTFAKPPDCSPTSVPGKTSKLKLGNTVQIAGYGATQADSNGNKVIGESDTLQCVEYEVVRCVNLSESTKKQHVFCTKRVNVDTCPGDSGGGVVFGGDQLYGVHKGAIKRACHLPGIVMDVCEYKDWIWKTTHIPTWEIKP